MAQYGPLLLPLLFHAPTLQDNARTHSTQDTPLFHQVQSVARKPPCAIAPLTCVLRRVRIVLNAVNMWSCMFEHFNTTTLSTVSVEDAFVCNNTHSPIHSSDHLPSSVTRQWALRSTPQNPPHLPRSCRIPGPHLVSACLHKQSELSAPSHATPRACAPAPARTTCPSPALGWGALTGPAEAHLREYGPLLCVIPQEHQFTIQVALKREAVEVQDLRVGAVKQDLSNRNGSITGVSGLPTSGGGGQYSPLARTPPPPKGSIDGYPKILPRLTLGPWR